MCGSPRGVLFDHVLACWLLSEYPWSEVNQALDEAGDAREVTENSPLYILCY